MEIVARHGASRHFQAVVLLQHQSNQTELPDLHILLHIKLG